MHKYSDLKLNQRDFIADLYDGMEVEGIHLMSPGASYSRAWIRYMAGKYCHMTWAPAWIVKDISRRDDTKSGHYFIPELQEFHEAKLESNMEAGAEMPIPDVEVIVDPPGQYQTA